MEFTFTPVRVGILVILQVAFWLLGGFEFPGDDFANRLTGGFRGVTTAPYC
jgi:hypothetical protein